jgi:hypothetical protein
MSGQNLTGKSEIRASRLNSGEAGVLRKVGFSSFLRHIKYTDGNSLTFFFIQSTWGTFSSGALITSDWGWRRRQAHFVGCRATRSSKALNRCANPGNMSSFVLSRLGSSPPCRLALEDLNQREQRIVQPLLPVPSLPPLRSRAMSNQITRTIL